MQPQLQPPSPPPVDNAAIVRQELAAFRALRCHHDEVFRNYFHAVQRWQVEMLAQRHQQFLADRRYSPVTRFFLEDMYALDLSPLASEAERALPLASRLMPDAALDAAAIALRLNGITGMLDQRVAEILFEQMSVRTISPGSYADAYRAASTRELRHQQLALLGQLGHELDRHVRSRLVYSAFRLSRRPAHLAGLGGLYDFLDRGFNVMRPMDSARQYITLFTETERRVVDNLFNGLADPFNVAPPALPPLR